MRGLFLLAVAFMPHYMAPLLWAGAAYQGTPQTPQMAMTMVAILFAFIVWPGATLIVYGAFIAKAEAK